MQRLRMPQEGTTRYLNLCYSVALFLPKARKLYINTVFLCIKIRRPSDRLILIMEILILYTVRLYAQYPTQISNNTTIFTTNIYFISLIGLKIGVA